MKKLILIMLLSIWSVGCASLIKDVQNNNIHEGDPKQRLVEVLGQPDTFQPSVRISGATAWYYFRRGEMCGFTIQDDVVKMMACGINPGYRNPAAAALQGMSDGMKESDRNRVHCDSDGVGGFDCR